MFITSPHAPPDLLPYCETSLIGCGVTLMSASRRGRLAGLALCPGIGTSDLMRIVFVRREGGAFAAGTFDADDAIAVWRRLAADFRLPLMIEMPDGCFETVRPQLGSVLLGPTRLRRRAAILNGRRPRFLTRRKTARLPAQPVVHRSA